MTKTLTRHGNSAALVIDKPILELLKIDMDTPLEILTDGRNLIISPVREPAREAKFRAALERVSLRHAKTHSRLSK